MKYILTLSALLLILASCGATSSSTQEDAAVEASVDSEIDGALEAELAPESEDSAVDSSTDETASGMVVVETSYDNPAGNVDMNISYTLNSDGTIASMDVVNEDRPQFADAVEAQVVGMTLEEAADIYVAGSSLASDAFSKALKSQM